MANKKITSSLDMFARLWHHLYMETNPMKILFDLFILAGIYGTIYVVLPVAAIYAFIWVGAKALKAACIDW